MPWSEGRLYCVTYGHHYFSAAKMGKLDHFEIVLSTQPAVYFPGQAVSGVLNVTLNDEMKMRNIRLKFQGQAKV